MSTGDFTPDANAFISSRSKGDRDCCVPIPSFTDYQCSNPAWLLHYYRFRCDELWAVVHVRRVRSDLWSQHYRCRERANRSHKVPLVQVSPPVGVVLDSIVIRSRTRVLVGLGDLTDRVRNLNTVVEL